MEETKDGWNYDLSAVPIGEDVLLLWPSREMDEETDMPTGEIVFFSRVIGQRLSEDTTEPQSWQAPEIDQMPNCDYFMEDHEHALTPHAWSKLLPAPSLARGSQ